MRHAGRPCPRRSIHHLRQVDPVLLRPRIGIAAHDLNSPVPAGDREVRFVGRECHAGHPI
eukprot:scaffold8449_cov277-Pinguiococcus_pyrenoidosus.AAC.1